LQDTRAAAAAAMAMKILVFIIRKKSEGLLEGILVEHLIVVAVERTALQEVILVAKRQESCLRLAITFPRYHKAYLIE
jgi:hypothetical protein